MGMKNDESTLAAFLDEHEQIDSTASIAANTILGEWRVASFLGRGGSSEVYRAIHISRELESAIKILSRDDDSSKMRFERERRFLMENECSSFPGYLGSGVHEGREFVVMELLEPMELPRGDKDVVKYILSVARATLELHTKGLVHRDLKPQNIMQRKGSGEPVIIDFGLLKPVARAGLPHPDTISVVDGKHVAVGTPGYAAPEQLVGEEISRATDVHALGVLMNQCFEGLPPRYWARIIQRATSSIPKQRYGDITDFMRAVRARHRWAHFLYFTLIAASIAIVAIAFWSKEEAAKARQVETRRALEEKAQKEHDEILEMLQRDVY